jgi:hypothetical protein
MSLPVSQAPATPFAWDRIAGPSADLPVLVAQLADARAIFSTRQGGTSAAPYESLNLGDRAGDEPLRVADNRQRLLGALGRDADSIAWALQVHGSGVEFHSGAPGRGFTRIPGRLPEADAQGTNAAGVTPLVLVADCLPLVIAAAGAVAVAHCGWRGVAAGIVPATIDAIRRESGLGPDRIEAALGPAIGPCCYEVGDDLVGVFTQRGHDAGRMLDLPAIVRAELEAAGIESKRISSCGICTCCNPDLFYSHRRDGERTGRQAGIAWLNS